MKSKTKVEFGDFQTPLGLARQVCAWLRHSGVDPDTIVEPTCGVGAFLLAAAETFPEAKLIGWDINPEYVSAACAALRNVGAAERSTVETGDFFGLDWKRELAKISGHVLFLGNPPWVTNAAVSGLNGSNLPTKTNVHGLRGIEARTGKSNFDISEWMLIELIKCLRGRCATIAMLCKTVTARKALRYSWLNDCQIAASAIRRIDAKKHFGAAVDASLLFLRTGERGIPEAEVFDDIEAAAPARTVGLTGQDLVSNLATYRELKHLEGFSPYQWRSGVKHDCSSVMELHRRGTLFQNKFGEDVDLEPEMVFPLLKCSDLANGRVETERFVLVTQTRVGEDTVEISRKAPKAWSYLNSHKPLFDARKSSIYANQAPFAMFGIGDYSFARWKVAISGLHKVPRFLLVPPSNDRPVFFDDTCYFLPFDDKEEASVVADILNSDCCRSFLSALVFEDSKRPITVELLQRLNLGAIASEAGLGEKWTAAREHQLAYSCSSRSFQAEFFLETPISKR